MEPLYIRYKKLQDSCDKLTKERNELLKKLASAKRTIAGLDDDVAKDLISVLKILNPSYYDDTFTRGRLSTRQLLNRVKEESESLMNRYTAFRSHR